MAMDDKSHSYVGKGGVRVGLIAQRRNPVGSLFILKA
jgi:hypothetical protein